MNKKTIIGIGCIAIVLVVLGIYLAEQEDKEGSQLEKTSDKENRQFKEISEKEGSQLEKIIEVDEVVEYPERFTGYIKVAGKVIEIEEAKNFFIIGCEDACISMPVRYEGYSPKAGKEVVVGGEIKKDENGKYFFEAKELKEK